MANKPEVSIEKLCKTCCFWDPKPYSSMTGNHICGCPKFEAGKPPYNISTLDHIVYVEDSFDVGDFTTGPNFGCIHHEPKV